MFDLLRTEWLKMKNYWAFWLVMGVTALSYPGINYIFNNIYQENIARKDATGQLLKMLVGNPFQLPELWHTAAFASSIFVFIPSIVVMMLITNEYTYKTTRQNIIDGWSRTQFMLGKLLDVVIITAVVTLLYTLLVIGLGLYNTPASAPNKWSQSYYIGLFALQTFAQLSVAFLVGLLVRKAFVALGIFIFYFVVVENFLVAFLRHYPEETNFWYDAGRFMPIEISDRIITPPAFMRNLDPKNYQKLVDSVNTYLVYTIILCVALWALNFWIYRKRDL